MKDFEKVLATWEMTSVEKLEAAQKAKDQGTDFLKAGKLKLAFDKYKRVEQLLEYEKSMDPEQKKARDVLILAAYLNLSLTAAKMDENLNCIKYCDKVRYCQTIIICLGSGNRAQKYQGFIPESNCQVCHE